MLTRRIILAALPAALSAQSAQSSHSSPKFARSYFFTKPDSQAHFADFNFGSERRGWAMGVVEIEHRRFRGLMVNTIDGGQNWTETDLKFLPQSFFALDDSQLWALSDKGEIWFSAEGGRDWRKLSKQENALRLHFLDSQRGFLIGAKKTLMRTEDGGKKWRHVPEGAQAPGNADYMTFRWIDFWNGKFGVVVGTALSPMRARRRRLPDWMDPEMAHYRNQLPTMSLSIETRDAGATWKSDSVSAFGQIHRTRIASDGTGLTVLRFEPGFAYGGELYSFSPKVPGSMERILRLKDMTFSDAFYIPGDGAYLVGTERTGIMPLPAPSRVKAMHSKDLKTWRAIPVDYRATAQNVYLAQTPAGRVFAATDEGAILALR